MESFSFLATVSLTVRFVLRHIIPLARAAIIPSLAWGLVFYLTFSTYLRKLQHILREPTIREATVLLGLSMGGLLLWIFTYAVGAAQVAKAAEGTRKPVLVPLISRADWRLFAAMLRLLLIVSLIGVTLLIINEAAIFLGASSPLDIALQLAFIAVVAVAFVRVGLLLPALALVGDGPMFRPAYRMTARFALKLALLIFCLLLPGVLIELGGELLLRQQGIFFDFYSASPDESTQVFLSALPQFTVLLTFSYLVTLILVTTASCFVLAQLSEAR